tara:strand:+ start:1189 stop:1542 length:354 start_codon:yes stop_codon:yes gene_type:complete
MDKKNKFLFNPKDPKKSFDVYIDKNPKDSIKIKYSNLNEVKQTIRKLEKLYKSDKYSHTRISQVAMILRVRLRVIKDRNPKIDKGRFKMAEKYTAFLKKRTSVKGDMERKKMKFLMK